MDASLKPEHYAILIDAYVSSIKTLRKYFLKPSINQFFYEIFEEEWRSFVFADT
jgi:hypothetical protein